jgi:hypothetical protein
MASPAPLAWSVDALSVFSHSKPRSDPLVKPARSEALGQEEQHQEAGDQQCLAGHGEAILGEGHVARVRRRVGLGHGRFPQLDDG